MLLLVLLLQFHKARALVGESTLKCSNDEWAERHWERSTLKWIMGTPAKGEQSNQSVVDQAFNMLPVGQINSETLKQTQQRLLAIDMTPLFTYERVVAHRESCTQTLLGPDLFALQDKPNLYASTEQQRKMQGSKDTAPVMISEDLDMWQHLEEAKKIVHPFDTEPNLEDDLKFAVDINARMGPNVVRFRSRAMTVLRQIKRAVKQLEKQCLALRPCQQQPGMAPAWIAVIVAALRWPDTALPNKLIFGFEILDVIEPARIFRQLPQEVVDQPFDDAFFGEPALEYIERLEADKRVHKNAADILKETVKEQQLGLIGPLVGRQHFDRMYGRGQWRPFPRHVVYQAEKCRPIDDGRAGGHNAAAKLSETIVTQRGTWLISLVKSLVCRIAELQSLTPREMQRAAWPHWLCILAALEDMWKGYRQNHVQDDHSRATIATFIHPNTSKRVYAQLFGLPFGLGVSVVQFNRVPMLQTAIHRRVCANLQAHYFDDSITAAFSTIAAATKVQVSRLANFMGVINSADKRESMSGERSFLGTVTDMSMVRQDLALSFAVKPSTRQKTLDTIEECDRVGRVTPGDASTIRGLVTWMDNFITGKPCRGALAALVARQYYERIRGDPVTDKLKWALDFIKLAVAHMPPRFVHVAPLARRPVIIYTDASEEDSSPMSLIKVGALIITAGQTLCYAATLPNEVVVAWDFRQKYISQAELIMGPLLALGAKDVLAGQDAVWFIDNTAALSAMIKAASPVEDSSMMALMAALGFIASNTRVWFEFVPSAQNCSDALSREGYDDPVVRKMLASGRWQKLMPEFEWSTLGRPSLRRLWEVITALGCGE